MKNPTRQRSPIRLESLEGRTLMSGPGSLDPNFGGGYGSTTIPLGVTHDVGGVNSAQPGGVAIQADGKIVVAGETTQNYATNLVLTRLNADGSVDSTFGQGGKVVTPLPVNNYAGPTSVVIQPDGKIVEAASAVLYFGGTGVQHSTYFVTRTNADGTPDTSFGTAGVAEYPSLNAGSSNAGLLGQVSMVLLQADGKLVIAGTSFSNPGNDFAAVRLNADGSLDTSFGKAGTVVVPVPVNGFSSAEVTTAAIQADGKLVLVGKAESGSRLVAPPDVMLPYEVVAALRLNADGSLDTSFGGSAATKGVVLLPADPDNPATLGVNFAVGAAIQADGKLLISGNDTIDGGNPAINGPTLYRLNTDGTLDASFGNAGRVMPSTSGVILIQPYNGQIVLGGLNGDVARLNADGSPDTSFGNPLTPGLETTALDSLSYPFAYAIRPANTIQAVNIIAAGSGSVGSGASYNVGFKVASVNAFPAIPVAKEQAPFNLDGSHQSDLAVYLPSIGAFAYRPTTGGPDVFVPFGIPGTGQTIPAVADYSGTGTAEIGAYLPSLGAYAYRPASGAADVVTYIGLTGAGQTIPAPADYDGTGKDDVAVYLPKYAGFAIQSYDGTVRTVSFGIAGAGQSIPTPGDYFGTGQADISVYLPSIGAFAIRNPNGTSPDEIIPFGVAGLGKSIPIPGDYDGSGKTELAVYIPSQGIFAYRPADGGPDVITAFGAANDGSIPVPGDYTGAGHAEVAIYDPNYAAFAYRPAGSDGGIDVIQLFGSSGVNPPRSLPVAAPTSTFATATLTSMSTSLGAKSVVPGGPASIARRASLSRVAQANAPAGQAPG